MDNDEDIDIKISPAETEDAPAIHRLVASCPKLDNNSRYLYLLLCSHFNRYTLTAKAGGSLAGFVAAYVQPKQSDTLFVWQIAVAPAYRRYGIAIRMLEKLIHLAAASGINYLEATVTPSNKASFNMFRKTAEKYQAAFKQSDCFDGSLFEKNHEKEVLLRIGPIKSKGSE